MVVFTRSAGRLQLSPVCHWAYGASSAYPFTKLSNLGAPLHGSGPDAERDQARLRWLSVCRVYLSGCCLPRLSSTLRIRSLPQLCPDRLSPPFSPAIFPARA